MSYKVTDTIVVDQSKNLGSIGIATFAGPLLIGGGSSTGTVSQPLQVLGTNGAYIGGNLGIGSINPSSKLWVSGDIYGAGIVTAYILNASKDPGTGIATDFTNSLFGNGWRVSSPGSTTYYKLATLPSGGGGNTFDHLIINGVLGAWTNGNQTPFEITFSNRGAFNYKYTSYGSIRSDVRIIGISTNSTVEIWAQHQASQFTKLVYNIPNSIEAIVVSNPTSTTTAPTGTTVFDSSTATPRFIINESDYVGIGTTTPTSKLQVVGDALVSGIVTANSFRGDGSLLTGIGGGISSISISSNITNQSQYLTYVTGTGNTTGLGVTTTGLVFNPSSGNLGIGTTNPFGSSIYSGLDVNRANVKIFARNIGSATDAAVWAADQDYFVGIGTTTPSYKGVGILKYGPGTAGTIFSSIPYADLGVLSFQNTTNALIWTNGQTPLIFATYSAERARFDGLNGNFGIGTTIPTSKLHVVGDVYVSGVVTATTFIGALTGTATNIKGGLAGNIHYQSAPDTTAFLSNGSSGTILQSNGVGNAPSWVAAAPAGAVTGITIRDSTNTVVGSSGSITQLTFSSGLSVTGATGASGIATITLSSNIVGTSLSISGISTFTNGPVLIGSGTSQGTANQTLQVTGGAYVSTRLGVGVTNPASNTQVAIAGTLGIGEVGGSGARTLLFSSTSGFTLNHNDNSQITFQTLGVNRLTYSHGSNFWTIPSGTPLLVGTATSTGTASQLLQVDSGAYVSGSVGIGSTNPTSKLSVVGDVLVSGVTTASRFVSNVAQGNAPISVASSTLVSNLNADYLDGLDSSYFTNASNLSSGTVPSARITASSGDFTVGQNLYVTGNLSVGGTSIVLNAAQLQIKDRDIVLGITTDANGNDISSENSATHGGISIASTQGSPLINLPIEVGINSLPSTYKQLMWVKKSGYSGMGTDAWVFNYGVSIGNTATVQNLSRLTVGAGFTVYDTYLDALDIRNRNLNASGVVTATTFSGSLANTLTLNTSGTGLSGSTTYNNSGAATFTVTSNATNANTVSTIVARDGSGNFSAGTITASLTGAASLNVLKAGDTMTGQLISTLANNTADGGGQIYLNGATGNRIDFNTNGSGAPTLTTRSVGTKIVLNPFVSATRVDTALGIEGATLWSSVPTSVSQFKWYASTTNIATLFGTGELVLGTTALTGTATQPLQVTGGAYVSGNLGVGVTNPSSKLQVTTASSDGNVSAWGTGQAVISPGGTSTSQGLGFSVDTTGGVSYLSSLTPGITWNSMGYRALSHSFYTFGSTLVARIDSSGNLLINNTSSTGTASQPLQVTGGAYVSGNLGVGVVSPAATLDVNGSINFASSGIIGPSNLNITTDTTQQYYFGLSRNGQLAARFNGMKVYNTAGGPGGLPASKLGFFTDITGAVGSTERMTITEVGNVGIGVTNPSSQLHVTGSAYVSGNLGVGATAPSFKADIAGDARVTSTNKMRFGGTAGTTNFYIQYNSTANSLDFVAG